MEPAQLAIQSMQSGSCSAPMTMVPPCCSTGAVVALADEAEVGAAGEDDEPPEELEEQAESARLAAAPPASSTMARRLRPSERVAVMGSSLWADRRRCTNSPTVGWPERQCKQD